jgi:hypothetical protein
MGHLICAGALIGLCMTPNGMQLVQGWVTNDFSSKHSATIERAE